MILPVIEEERRIVAAGGGGPVIFQDSMTDTNGTLYASHAADVGQVAFNISYKQFATDTPAPQIQANALEGRSVSGVCAGWGSLDAADVPGSVTSCMIECICQRYSPGSWGGPTVELFGARIAGIANNTAQLTCKSPNGTSINVTAATSLPFYSTIWHKFKMEWDGTYWRYYHNDTLVRTTTDNTVNTTSLILLYLAFERAVNTHRFDDVVVKVNHL